MRSVAISSGGDFQVKVIGGTRTIMMALNCPDGRRKGLRGFSFHRTIEGAATGKWLRSQKVFQSVVPNPKKLVDGKAPVFTTEQFPVQSFLWSDYTAEPGTRYEFRILPMYGKPGALKSSSKDAIMVTIQTEAEYDPNGHSIWFNRGAIASQHFAHEFGDIKPSAQQLDDLTQPVTKWLSRGLAEACLQFINDVPAGDTLYACVYEFTYKPVLNALKAAIDRGVEVRISHHSTPANNAAITAAEIPDTARRKKVLFPRTVPKIPHNKFFIRISDGVPVAIFTGSTNISTSGFLGQSNVGHQINDPVIAAAYLEYWKLLSKDPAADIAKAAVKKLTPHPFELPPENSTTLVFSPRYRKAMLQWYANRMLDASASVMFTAAFGVSDEFVLPLAQDRDFLRFVLMEKRPTKELQDKLRVDRDLVLSYGAVLGEIVTYKDGKRVTQKIKEFGLDQWFQAEELYRKAGNVFFVHTKFLLIDPLSDDPLVCTGSANFSENSLTGNDENMLLIRGNTRVADIYMTEFDRIFRHFYFRNVANEIEIAGKKAQGAFLDETDEGPTHWTNAYFYDSAFKKRRREMFFTSPTPTWAENAAQRAEDESGLDADAPQRPRKPQR